MGRAKIAIAFCFFLVLDFFFSAFVFFNTFFLFSSRMIPLFSFSASCFGVLLHDTQLKFTHTFQGRFCVLGRGRGW